jgi:hypothetical protein
MLLVIFVTHDVIRVDTLIAFCSCLDMVYQSCNEKLEATVYWYTYSLKLQFVSVALKWFKGD